MDFIVFNTWILLPFNQWYHTKKKKLTLKHGLLWNTIILKSEPPYYAFTPQHPKMHYNKDPFAELVFQITH
jgi:hypothetical protein